MSRINWSLYSDYVGVDNAKQLISRQGFLAGAHGNQFDFPAPTRVVHFDDFLGDTLNTFLYHNPTKGSDGATADFAVLQDVNGKIRGTTGAGAGASMAANGILIDTGLLWKPSVNAPITFQTRLQVSAITNLCLYAGFTDQVSTLEMPFTISGATLTSNATDAVGFLYDTAATASTWKLVGVANDVDATVLEAKQSTATATTSPVAATYVTLRVSVTATGMAYFFIDGKPVGGQALSSSTTPAVALTGVVAAFTRSAASATVDVDYLHIAGNRS